MIFKKHFSSVLLIWLAFTTTCLAQFDIPPKPKEQTSVYDYINLLSGFEKSSLEQKLIKYSDTTSTQIVVAIISTTKGENIGLLAPKWGHEWGVGQAKEDNGVFILLAKDDRKIWIAPGYGVEPRLTAGINGEIIRNIIIPEFKLGNFYAGLDKGADAIFEVLNGEFQGTRPIEGEEFPFGFIFFLIIFFIIFIIAISKKRGGGRGNNRGNRSTGMDILEAIILSNMGRGNYRGGGRIGGGGFGGGSFGGGGFGGGFGGGGFSGGGAGGSW